MIGRILWTATLIGVGALTAGLQLDRQAERDPSVAPLVPAPLRAYAQLPITAAALQGTDAAAALAEAETLVRRRPLPAEHLTLLAAAQAKAGEAEAATFSIAVAGERGWRDPVAQEAVLRIALAGGDQAEAARRYAALFRAPATPDALLASLAPEVLGEPGGTGQQTFAEVLAAAPRWHAQFLERGPRVLPPEAFALIAAKVLLSGAKLDCGQLGTGIAVLRGRDAGAAERLATAAAGRCRELAPPGTFPL
ncbi:hypothetical protein ACLBKU_13515 [Erythrobacter sp. NE805]|uniref:hypothetical protein n=1 Tax=Erythrobacter sp. NE805 TaxID=3389875 RepID=UPI00396B2863